MDRLEKIGKRYNRPPEQVEQDLMSILRWKGGDCNVPTIIGLEYCDALINLLLRTNCIEEGFGEYIITSEGQRVLQQGYIIYDYQTPKIEKEKKVLREQLSLCIAAIGLIIGLAGLFFPRPKAGLPGVQILNDAKLQANQDTICFESQVDEIAQTSDSTKKQGNSDDE